MIRQIVRLLIAAAFAPTVAAASDETVRVSVRNGYDLGNGTHVAGIEFTLADGWKTYWRAPGDAGIPPLFDFSKSKNLAGATVVWPIPHVFDQNGYRSVGYKHSVIVPVVLRPETSGPILLDASIDIGVCSDICVPHMIEIQTKISRSSKQDSLLAAALRNVPSQVPSNLAKCEITPEGRGASFAVDLALPSLGADEYAVVETNNPMIWVSEAAIKRTGDSLSISAQMEHVAGKAMSIGRGDIRMTVLAGDRAVEIDGCVGR